MSIPSRNTLQSALWQAKLAFNYKDYPVLAEHIDDLFWDADPEKDFEWEQEPDANCQPVLSEDGQTIAWLGKLSSGYQVFATDAQSLLPRKLTSELEQTIRDLFGPGDQ